MPERFATRLSRRLGTEAMLEHHAVKVLVGLALIGLGVAAIMTPDIAGPRAVRVAGAILMAAGIFQAALALTAHRDDTPTRELAVGLANFGVGTVFVSHTTASLATLTLVLAVAYVVIGANKAIGAYRERGPHWPWIFALGALLVIFGTLIGLRWPESSFKVLGRFVGVQLVAEGVTWIMIVRRALQGADMRITMAPEAPVTSGVPELDRAGDS